MPAFNFAMQPPQPVVPLHTLMGNAMDTRLVVTLQLVEQALLAFDTLLRPVQPRLLPAPHQQSAQATLTVEPIPTPRGIRIISTAGTPMLEVTLMPLPLQLSMPALSFATILQRVLTFHGWAILAT